MSNSLQNLEKNIFTLIHTLDVAIMLLMQNKLVDFVHCTGSANVGWDRGSVVMHDDNVVVCNGD